MNIDTNIFSLSFYNYKFELHLFYLVYFMQLQIGTVYLGE